MPLSVFLNEEVSKMDESSNVVRIATQRSERAEMVQEKILAHNLISAQLLLDMTMHQLSFAQEALKEIQSQLENLDNQISEISKTL